MTTLFDIPATLAQQAAPADAAKAVADALPQTAGGRMTISICAMGLCVLGVWIVRRVLYRRKFLLRDAPGRPNSLGWLHIAIILLCIIGGKLWPLLSDPPDAGGTVTTDGLVSGLIMMLGILAVSLAIAHAGFKHGIVRGLGLTTRRWFTDSARGMFGILAVFPICFGLFLLGQMLIPEHLKAQHVMLEFLAGDATVPQQILIVFIAAIVAPVVEEVLYRGLLQTALRRVCGGPWPGIIISSVLFASVHLSIMREPLRVVGVQAMAPLFALSIVMGYSYERTGRLGASILIHMMFNGINLLQTFLDAA